MEERGALLSGIAKILNAGGSALLIVYDALSSTVSQLLPGEKEKLKSQIRIHEKKIDQLYYEIGKEVTTHTDMTQAFAATEAGTKSVVECQAAIENIKRRFSEIEEEERIGRENARKGKEAARMARDREVKERVIASLKGKAGEEKTESVPEPEKMEEAVSVVQAAAATDTERDAEAAPETVGEPDIAEAFAGAETEDRVAAESEAETAEEEPAPVEAEAIPEADSDETVESVEAEASAIPETDEQMAVPPEKPATPEEEPATVEPEVIPEADSGETAEPVEAEAIPEADSDETVESVEAEASAIPETDEQMAVLPEKPAAPEEALPEYAQEDLERMRKRDLRELCKTRGIEVDETITKAEIIQLLL